MNLRPFVIDAKIKEKLTKLKEYAEAHPISLDDLLNKRVVAGDHEEFTVKLPFGYRVVYSLEKQNIGDVRHLSMSVNQDKKLPNPRSVNEVMKMLGFTKPLEGSIVKMENISPTRQAINVLEIINKQEK